jgi:hypothetical protein
MTAMMNATGCAWTALVSVGVGACRIQGSGRRARRMSGFFFRDQYFIFRPAAAIEFPIMICSHDVGDRGGAYIGTEKTDHQPGKRNVRGLPAILRSGGGHQG